MRHMYKKTIEASSLTKALMISLALALFGLALPFLSQAHGIATSKQVAIGPYLLEFEYESLELVPSQEPVGYTIRLIEQQSNTDVAFDYAFVRIQKDNHTVFNSHVA